MQVRRLRLRNFKCYESVDVELSDGVTVIYGVNGSGKSSLLEACFFALYGTASLPSGTNLESIVTKGASETELELWFEHKQNQYHLDRQVRITDSQPVHDASLRTPDAVIETITEVEDRIERVLRMDADAFLNCAYVRQGDITRLLSASPNERQRMIDELLQLGKLETYRERMDQARVGVDRVRRDHASKLDDVRDEIETLEARELEDQLAEVKERIQAVESDLGELKDTIDEKTTLVAEFESELSEIEEYRHQLEHVREDLQEKRAQLTETKNRRSELETLIEDLAAERETLRESLRADLTDSPVSLVDEFSGEQIESVHDRLTTRLDDLDEKLETVTGRLEETRREAQEAAAASQRIRDQVTTVEEQAKEHEERAETLRAEAEQKRTKQEELEQRLGEKQTLIDEKESRFDKPDTPDEIEFGDAGDYREQVEGQLAAIREKKENVQSSLQAREQRVEHAETLIEQGKCPECGQNVDDAPEVATLAEDREEVESLRTRLASLTGEMEELESDLERARALVQVEAEIEQIRSERDSFTALLDEHQSRIDDLVASATEFRESAKEKREAAEDLKAKAAKKDAERDAAIAEIEEFEEEQSELESQRSSLREVRHDVTEFRQLVEKLETVENRLEDVTTLRDEQQAAVRDLMETNADLEETLDSDRISTLEADHESANQELEDLKKERDRLESVLNELTEKRGEIRGELNRLETVSARAETLEEKVNALESVVSECADIQELYSSLRTELRHQNVRQLELLLNEIFDLVYQNDSYSRITLSDEYELSIIEKSEEVLDPGELSGGEKALFNLSLRCAIYQLLAEGISGQAPLPPLILDEPTVHLDGEHVNRISDLVDRMRDLGVEQTIVVSHEAGIVDGADDRIEVIQNPSTNRSTVNVESTDLLAGLTG